MTDTTDKQNNDAADFAKELQALETVTRTLEPLTDSQRARILGYVASRFHVPLQAFRVPWRIK